MEATSEATFVAGTAIRLRPIPGGVEAQSPAKVNLFLELLGKRSDGYHEVETFMAAVDERDTLLAFDDESSDELVLDCDDPSVPSDSRNLVVRAAERLRREYGVTRGARLELRKSIPSESGLGGGSGDAAAALVALNRLWQLEAPPARLMAMAAELGSDVPFFLSGPAAVGRGRGEAVQPMQQRSPIPYWLVLVRPSFGLSTAEVYSRASVPAEPRSVEPIVRSWTGGDPAALGAGLFNRLQSAALVVRPELAETLDALGRLDTLLHGSCLSGSGSACFGLAKDRNAAMEAAVALTRTEAPQHAHGWVRVVSTLGGP